MKGNGLHLGIIVCCLAATAILSFRSLCDRPEASAEARNIARALPWYKCTRCGLEVQIPADQLDSLRPREVSITGAASSPGIRAMPTILSYVACTNCRDTTALYGNRCELHQLVYYSFNPDGTRGACKECVRGAAG